MTADEAATLARAAAAETAAASQRLYFAMVDALLAAGMAPGEAETLIAAHPGATIDELLALA